MAKAKNVASQFKPDVWEFENTLIEAVQEVVEVRRRLEKLEGQMIKKTAPEQDKLQLKTRSSCLTRSFEAVEMIITSQAYLLSMALIDHEVWIYKRFGISLDDEAVKAEVA